jgi:mono/diheme cytochrome c family protein
MMRPILISGATAALLLAATALAQPVTIELPFGEVPAELADPEAELVVARCSGCHSLDYVTTQPRSKGPAFWRDSVTKMVNVYHAPLTPEEAEAVAKVLAERFG